MTCVHDSLCSRRACACSEAGFSNQNGDRVWGVYYPTAAFCCAFMWAKGLNVKDIHKDTFPVYGGKSLPHKAVHKWVEKRGKRFEIETEVRKWLRKQSKRLLCCRFRRTGNAMGQVYQSWWRICREINVFSPGSNITFYVVYTFVTYLLTVPGSSEQS
jgi:hypothetical protein